MLYVRGRDDEESALAAGVIRHVEEVTHNVAKTCRYYGISRMAFYRWYRRYQEEGEEGLYDRSKRPHNCPRATKPEIVAKILYLRQTYHFGLWKIKMYLLRYHDVTISSSGIWRILKKLNMSRLPQYQRYTRHDERWKRYEKPGPGFLGKYDFVFLREEESGVLTRIPIKVTIKPKFEK